MDRSNRLAGGGASESRLFAGILGSAGEAATVPLVSVSTRRQTKNATGSNAACTHGKQSIGSPVQAPHEGRVLGHH